MIPQRLVGGPWLLRHPIKPGLAWTGTDWTTHYDGTATASSTGKVLKFSSKSHAIAYRLGIWETLPKAMQNQIDAAARAENGPYLPQDAPGGAK